MKRLIGVVVICLMTLGLYAVSNAGTIGNPTSTVEKGKISGGLDIDIISRDLKADESGAPAVEVKSNRILLKGAYGVNAGNIPLDVYGKVGMANVDPEDQEYCCDVEDSVLKVKATGDYGFAVGAGVKATVHEIPNVARIGVGVQLLNFTSKVTEKVAGDETKSDITNFEYDIFAGGAYTAIKDFVPYGGIALSKVNGKSKATGFPSVDINEDKSFGIFLGGDYSIQDRLKAGLELRLIDETSFALSISYLLM